MHMTALAVRVQPFAVEFVKNRQDDCDNDGNSLRVLIVVHRRCDMGAARKFIRNCVRVPRHDEGDKAAQ